MVVDRARQCGMKTPRPHSHAYTQLDPIKQECAAFDAATRRVDRASAATVRRTSKRCPKCRAPTEKDGGCNHVSCAICHYEWCWLCNGKYTPLHYSPTNILFGCPGAQFLDLGAAGRGGAATCCSCVPGQLTASLCRLLRVTMATLLLPGPLVLGAAVALAVSLLWLPIGLAWALVAACRRPPPRPRPVAEEAQHRVSPLPRPLVSCMGGGWEAFDLAFPLVSCTRSFRESNGGWGKGLFVWIGPDGTPTPPPTQTHSKRQPQVRHTSSYSSAPHP